MNCNEFLNLIEDGLKEVTFRFEKKEKKRFRKS